MLGIHVAAAKSNASWKGFFQNLKARGLRDVYLVTSDAHEGIQHCECSSKCSPLALFEM